MVRSDARRSRVGVIVKIWRVLLCSLLVVSAAAACGTPYSAWSYHEGRRAADRLADDERYDDAIAAYTELSKKAETQQDLQYLQYRTALMLERKGDADAALRAYEQIYSRPIYPYDQVGARAMYRAGRVYRDLLNDDDTAFEVWKATIRAYPDTFHAEDALSEIRNRMNDEGRQAEYIDLVTTLFLELQYTELADNLAYEAAKMLDDHFDRCEEAIELYDLLQTNFPRSGLVDDAIWRTGLCYRHHGDIDAEAKLLEKFVGGRELSIIIGDYDYAWYNPAFKRLAEIEEERGNLLAAIKAYRRFQETFPLSLDNDDMSYKIIQLYDELGNVKQMRRYLDEMKKFWPESRYIPRAEEMVRRAEERQ